ncbi:MAG: endonuclease III domain-containing protein [Acidobacteriota bacterium]|uniref:Endonuclease III n=1 Tax=Thermoanaerobaculum aquaticum TaxID=1312852 RepID=A0A062XPM0_9BACT|nr:endonuclease III [Thermoanaerobaculum aquaticum]KDA54537.1 endonuclease III [Thermoanaerobaculum aquaticum]
MSWTKEDLTWLLTTLHGAVRGFPATTLAHVEKSRDPFRLLVACVISLRTKDQVTAQAAARLFAVAPDAMSLSQLPAERIAQLIYPAGFYRTKARQLQKLAQILVERWGGRVPESREELLSLPGVGRKTANLVLGLGFGIPAICVDTHVHRIANRLGLVQTRRPEETETALEQVLPSEWWIPINDVLVTFGQEVCTPVSPRCSRCPVSSRCPKIGVNRQR